MKNNLGMGVMIGMLSGSEETKEAIQASRDKEIKSVKLDDNALKFEFTDNSTLMVWDDGQSCCERRWMDTSDNLDEFYGSRLMGFTLKDGPSTDQEWESHDIQFLDVTTSKGVFQMATHNQHNGYYGGFWICASLDPNHKRET